MWDVLEDAFTGAVGSFVTIILIVIFVAIFASWLILPFILWNIKNELKKLRRALEEKKKDN
ncbi:MAG: hypothetical protein J7J73_02695 [Deltaproteobacteria bacterium]|nr:hypothetical protein [Deltaproteobacteria bacterium]